MHSSSTLSFYLSRLLFCSVTAFNLTHICMLSLNSALLSFRYGYIISVCSFWLAEVLFTSHILSLYSSSYISGCSISYLLMHLIYSNMCFSDNLLQLHVLLIAVSYSRSMSHACVIVRDLPSIFYLFHTFNPVYAVILFSLLGSSDHNLVLFLQSFLWIPPNNILLLLLTMLFLTALSPTLPITVFISDLNQTSVSFLMLIPHLLRDNQPFRKLTDSTETLRNASD